MIELTALISWIYKASLGIVMLGFVFCFLRMTAGPTLPDRVMALDLTVNLIILFIAIYSIVVEQPIYMDVVIALALIIFLGTVAFAQLIEQQSRLINLSSNKKEKERVDD